MKIGPRSRTMILLGLRSRISAVTSLPPASGLPISRMTATRSGRCGPSATNTWPGCQVAKRGSRSIIDQPQVSLNNCCPAPTPRPCFGVSMKIGSARP